jgi:RimJ/RimL family protein N-acetyltransferase
MKEPETSQLPDTTIETLARGFFKEATAYGFTRMDYVRFVNILLDAAMTAEESLEGASETKHQPRPLHNQENEPNDSHHIDAAAAHLPLISDSVTIRAFEPAHDTGMLRGWVDDEFGRYFLLSATTARHEELEQLINARSTVMGVIEHPDGTSIGVIAYLNRDSLHRKAELRKLIGEPGARGKGLGRAATKLWIQYGRSGLELKKIYLNTLDTNIRNIRLNEEIGFKIEGILRNEVLVDDTYRDVLRMSLLIP